MTLICLISNVQSQDLKVTLSISYKKQVDTIFSKGDTINNPYLNISYQNNYPFPIYFVKTNSRNGLPNFPFGSLMNTPLSKDQLAMLVHDFKDSTYYISISNRPSKGNYWEAFVNEVDTLKRVIEYVNDNFKDMYDYI